MTTNHTTPEPIRLTTSGGLHLAADRWGNPTHPPVLCLHGAGQSRRAWDDTAHAVAHAGWHAITAPYRRTASTPGSSRERAPDVLHEQEEVQQVGGRRLELGHEVLVERLRFTRLSVHE